MSVPLEKFKTTIEKNSRTSIPRGELWLGTELLVQAGGKDSLEDHIRMADRLGHAMVCLPISHDPSGNPAMGYRYFPFRDIRTAADLYDGPVLAVVDGPFQELVNKIGLLKLMTDWISKEEEIRDAYQAESQKALALISQALDGRASAIVIADDFASDKGPFVSPRDIETLCTPFYIRAVEASKRNETPVFLHSCGNLASLIPAIRSWHIHGFASVQSRINDLPSLYREFDSRILIMAGIETEMLEADSLPSKDKERLEQLLTGLGQTGDLILGSSCGLYSGEYLNRMEKIYDFADNCCRL